MAERIIATSVLIATLLCAAPQEPGVMERLLSGAEKLSLTERAVQNVVL